MEEQYRRSSTRRVRALVGNLLLEIHYTVDHLKPVSGQYQPVPRKKDVKMVPHPGGVVDRANKSACKGATVGFVSKSRFPTTALTPLVLIFPS